MFIAKKIVSLFLLPPGLFVSVLLLMAFMLHRRKQPVGGAALVFGALLIWALSISPVSDALLHGLEAGFKIPDHPKGDVIVLLGGGVRANAPDIGGTGIPSEEMLARTVAALRLHHRTGLPIIISGGDPYGRGGRTEAEIVTRYLTDLGVQAAKVIAESKSRDTRESAALTKEILASHDFGAPILVTSAIHMKRSVLLFKRAGVEVTPYPVNFKTWEGGTYGLMDWLPHANESAAALHEYLGLAFYALVR